MAQNLAGRSILITGGEARFVTGTMMSVDGGLTAA